MTWARPSSANQPANSPSTTRTRSAQHPRPVPLLLRHEAQRRGITVSARTREAVEHHLGGRSGRRRLRAAGAGRSGRDDVSDRIDETLAAELAPSPLIIDEARQARLQQAESDFEPLPFDAAAARAFGQVAASLRRSGHKTAARNYDAMIAAVAIANGLALYTCNPTDFAGIDGLSVVAAREP